jgi:hypothetical protein
MTQPSPSDRPTTQDAGRKGINRSMDGWRTLDAAIPRGLADRVADFLRIHPNTVRSWMREPQTDDDVSTGRRSPLDRSCELLTAIYLVNPAGADLLLEHLRSHVESLKETQRPRPLGPGELEEKIQQAQLLLQQLADEVRASKKEKLQIAR